MPMRNIVLLSGVALLAVAFSGGVAQADIILQGDPAAMTSGSLTYSTAEWTAQVQYAVYAPGQYGGTDPDKLTNYVYAYQVFDDAASQVTLSSFNVGLITGAGAVHATSDGGYGTLGGQAPLLSRLVGSPAGSVQWSIDVAPGQYTTVLLFSSPNSWTLQPASLVDHGTTDTHSLPSPVPEPASMGLLLLGGLGCLLRRRRKL